MWGIQAAGREGTQELLSSRVESTVLVDLGGSSRCFLLGPQGSQKVYCLPTGCQDCTASVLPRAGFSVQRISLLVHGPPCSSMVPAVVLSSTGLPRPL